MRKYFLNLNSIPVKCCNDKTNSRKIQFYSSTIIRGLRELRGYLYQKHLLYFLDNLARLVQFFA